MNEYLVLADLSENYSLVAQEHWSTEHHSVNKHTTVHPCVMYHKDEDKLQNHTFCVIRGHHKHNNTTVHAF